MDVGKVFFILKENDKITRQELYDCGASDDEIIAAVEKKLLVSINDEEFKAGDPEELVYFGRYLIETKDTKGANSVFNCAYVNNFNNYVVNYQLFYRSLIEKKRARVLKHFQVVRDNLIKEGRKYDANYYLFLLGSLYELDDRYKQDFINLEETDILVPGKGEFVELENKIRSSIFSISYYNVTTLLDERFDYEDRKEIPFEDMVEKELLLQWLYRRRNFNKNLSYYLDTKSMEEIQRLLNTEDDRRGLNTTNQYVLKIVNSYLTIQDGDIPEVKDTEIDTFEAINGNNYELALALEENRANQYNVIRETNLHKVLVKIIELINSKKNGEEVAPTVSIPRPVIDSKKLPLEEKVKQAIDSKIEKMRNGERNIFLLEPMSKEKRDVVRSYLISQEYKDVTAFSIGEEPKQIILRYKPRITTTVNLKETLEDARAFRESKDWGYAADYYALALKIGKPKESTYAGYGISLMKLGKTKEAIDCLKIATIMSKTEGDGRFDYTDLIQSLECPTDKDSRKPRVVVQESEFEDKKESKLDEDLLNTLIGLYAEGDIDLLEACKQLNMSEEDINYVKLLYARDCYYKGNDKTGDLYLKQVERSKAKNQEVKDLFKEIQASKKYYRNRYDESKNQIVFIKK